MAPGPAPAPAASDASAPRQPPLADPYGISEARPIPQPTHADPGVVGANPYRGPGAGPVRVRRERPVYACPAGVECEDLWSRGHERAAFVQLLSGAFHLRERVSSPIAFGGELGGFVHDRVRGSIRGLVPVSEASDQATDDNASVWLWGASLGVAAEKQSGFVLSPSLQYLGVIGGDYGHLLGIHLPFEWLGARGFRIGFDFAMLYGFGGTYETDSGRVEERPNSTGVTVNFLVGHVFASGVDQRSRCNP